MNLNIDLYLEKSKQLSTPELSDALDYFSLPGSLLGIRHIAGNQRIAGTAWTVRYIAVDPDNIGTVGDYIDDVQSGDVVVIDNAARKDCTVWGGILSQLAASKKIAGTVINGVSRDTDEANQSQYPIYALGHYMRTGKDRVQVAAVCEPISISGVTIKNGDVIVADIDGVVVIGRHHLENVIDRALQMQTVERSILSDVLSGMRISDARKKHNYHLLQRNPNKR
ncbi:RraA family protein [Dickeya solani]|uniref:Putative 4-hydroxy-4-methyl-2-oxoglutarate aldolase n=1 Tax=Dickeya solani D s0432-1 TaxID=1231725 RepID=A0AAV3K705_9GAMM|nr:RraA family protein [Dickeya solani]ANE74389.1 diguanylate cyclase [Dickeya solani IPO 2222]AUC41626.1 Demethylmenaquinone methyltransferase [Dickeya solani RNS 08.23.3.1.A]AUH10195.1 diguanylate cyclase [Dickeya solani D s0432-1]AUH14142.1 diguanylate cyclase [Dickeya solani]AYQ48857.1 Putative regulator of ribonuclease activity [Dickeya solani]